MSPLYSLWFSRMVGGIGYQIFAFSGLYQIYKNTQSAFMTGMMGLWLFLPAMGFNLFVGNWADKVRRPSRAYLGLQLGTVALGLALFSEKVMASSAYLFLVIAVYSLLRAARSPFFYILMNQSGELATATNQEFSKGRLSQLSTLSWQIPLILGPSLFSWAQSFGGNKFVAGATLMCFTLASAASWPLLRLPAVRLRVERKMHTPDWKSLIQRNQQWLRASLADVLVMGSLVFSSLMPFLLNRIHEDPAKLGYLKAAISFGAFLCVGVFEFDGLRNHREKCFRGALALACLCVALLPSIQHLVGLLFLCFAFGFCDGFSILYRDFLLFSIPREDLGKASALSQTMNSGSEDLGEFRAGVVAGVFSPAIALYAGAGIAAVATLFYCFGSKELQTFDSLKTDSRDKVRA